MAITKFKSNKQPFVDASIGAGSAASLLLNFTHKNGFNSLLNISRSTTSTLVNSRGFVEVAPANTLRISHDPVTLECKGLLVEPTRTNLLSNSNNFSVWSQMAPVTVSQNQPGPDGTTSGWTLTDNSTGGDDGAVYNAISVTPSTTTRYCLSVFVRAGSATFLDVHAFFTGSSTKGSMIRYEFSTNTLTPGAADGVGIVPTAFGVINHANGWKRIWFVVTDANSGLNNSLQIRISGAGRSIPNTGNSIIYGAQMEVGGFPTSYIPTTTSSVTRNADVISITGSNFYQWYNRLEGTIYAEFESSSTVPSVGASDFETVFAVHTSANLNSHGIYAKVDSNGQQGGGNRVTAASFLETVNQALLITPTDITSNCKVAYGYSLNNAAAAFDGKLIGTDNTVSLPFPTSAHIGSRDGINVFSGWIKNIAFYPKRFTNEEIKVLSLT